MRRPSPSRIQAVFQATETWRKNLVDTTGRNRLRRYRDLKTGTLDLTPGMSQGLDTRVLDRLFANRTVKLSDLLSRFPVDPVGAPPFDDGRRRLAAIHKTALTNSEEKGIETLFAAVGIAAWDVDSGSAPNAPVILIPLDAEATGAAARDFSIRIAGDAHLNPVLAHISAPNTILALTKTRPMLPKNRQETSIAIWPCSIDCNNRGTCYPIWS